MGSPLVSILITAYNRAKYIEASVRSVLRSSYTNLEVIIVDDRSTDDTWTIVQSLAALDHRIRIFQNERNLKQFQNRNQAASYARGKYIKFVDSDDIIYTYAISQMVDAMEQFPEASFGVFSNRTNDTRPYPYLADKTEAYVQYFTQGADILGMGPMGVIFRTDFFHAIRGFQDFSILGDTSILFEAIQRSPVVKIGASQFWWRLHDDQVYTNPALIAEHIIQRKRIHLHYLSDSYTADISLPVTTYRKKQTQLYYRHMLRFIMQGEWSRAKSLWVNR